MGNNRFFLLHHKIGKSVWPRLGVILMITAFLLLWQITAQMRQGVAVPLEALVQEVQSGEHRVSELIEVFGIQWWGA